MHLQSSLLLGLCAAAVQALPRADHEAVSATITNSIPESTAHQIIDKRVKLEPEKPIYDTIPGTQRKALFVPMLYAAWMDAKTGKWKRWHCQVEAGKGKQNKIIGNKCEITKSDDAKANRDKPTDLKKEMYTEGLASCTSINIISKKGAILLHIPPTLCSIFLDKGNKKNFAKNPEIPASYSIVKKMAKELVTHIKKDMGGEKCYQVVAFTGQKTVQGKSRTEIEKEVKAAIQYLFELKSFTSSNYHWEQQGGSSSNLREQADAHGTTRTDLEELNNPKLYNEEQPFALTLPNDDSCDA